MKNDTIIEATLKNQLAANAQAIGRNTIAVQKITEGLKQLAKETGEWRKDDKAHHKVENKLDEEKIEKMDSLDKSVKELIEFLSKE